MRENTDALRWVEFSLVYWEEQETLEQDNVFSLCSRVGSPNVLIPFGERVV